MCSKRVVDISRDFKLQLISNNRTLNGTFLDAITFDPLIGVIGINPFGDSYNTFNHYTERDICWVSNGTIGSSQRTSLACLMVVT
jgi:hypothetical protein